MVGASAVDGSTCIAVGASDLEFMRSKGQTPVLLGTLVLYANAIAAVC